MYRDPLAGPIARCSFIQLRELEQCRVKKPAHGLSPQHRIRTRIISIEPAGLKWTSDFKKKDGVYVGTTDADKRLRGKLFLISKKCVNL